MTTLPALLQEGSCRTIHLGKAHFGSVDSFGSLPENFGFDVNIDGCADGCLGSYYGKDHFGSKNGNGTRAAPGLKVKRRGDSLHGGTDSRDE